MQSVIQFIRLWNIILIAIHEMFFIKSLVRDVNSIDKNNSVAEWVHDPYKCDASPSKCRNNLRKKKPHRRGLTIDISVIVKSNILYASLCA